MTSSQRGRSFCVLRSFVSERDRELKDQGKRTVDESSGECASFIKQNVVSDTIEGLSDVQKDGCGMQIIVYSIRELGDDAD